MRPIPLYRIQPRPNLRRQSLVESWEIAMQDEATTSEDRQIAVIETAACVVVLLMAVLAMAWVWWVLP